MNGRWEFKRRDPEYLAAWREAKRIRKSGDPQGKKEEGLAKRFELYGGAMLDPSKSPEELCKERFALLIYAIKVMRVSRLIESLCV